MVRFWVRLFCGCTQIIVFAHATIQVIGLTNVKHPRCIFEDVFLKLYFLVAKAP